MKSPAAAFFFLAACQIALTQTPREKLDEMAKLPTVAGFEISHDLTEGALPGGGSTTYHLTLYEGYEYLALAAGDADATQLDLTIYDENWLEVAKNRLGDHEKPMLEIEPRWTGLFHVKVKMTRCETSTCLFGLLFLSAKTGRGFSSR